MQKYKRPSKYGLRSIPLRNPRRVDMFRYDPDTGKMKAIYEKPIDGPTEECFTSSGHGMMIEFKRLIVRTGNPYISLTLFHRIDECYFVVAFALRRMKYISKTYNKIEEALRKHDVNQVEWVKCESY